MTIRRVPDFFSVQFQNDFNSLQNRIRCALPTGGCCQISVKKKTKTNKKKSECPEDLFGDEKAPVPPPERKSLRTNREDEANSGDNAHRSVTEGAVQTSLMLF